MTKKTVKSRVKSAATGSKTALKKTVESSPAKLKKPVETAEKPVKSNPKQKKAAPLAPEKKRRERKPHATRPTPAEELIIAQRRSLVLDLRCAGVSIRKISRHLQENGYEHHSPATVHADLEAELDELNKSNLTKIENLRDLELLKIEEWELSITPDLKKPRTSVYEKTAIVGVCIGLQNQRDKFLNISKPKEIKINVADELAKLLDMDPAELPEDPAAATDVNQPAH